MTRALTIRRKVKAPQMPAFYVDVEHDGFGNPIEIAISEPSKFDNTAIGTMMQALVLAVNESIQEIRRHHEPI